jgi:hypothetical protein
MPFPLLQSHQSAQQLDLERFEATFPLMETEAESVAGGPPLVPQ